MKDVVKLGNVIFLTGNSDCVKLLIAMDACLEAYDLYYGTPLHVACVNAHTECVKVLLNAGACHYKADSLNGIEKNQIRMFANVQKNTMGLLTRKGE